MENAKKILAIDDQEDNLITLKAIIKNNIPNAKVITALSGDKGIEIAITEQPDTILLDIIMPKRIHVLKCLQNSKKKDI